MSLVQLLKGWRRSPAPMPLAEAPALAAALAPAAAQWRVRSVSRSHVGKVRQINEDRVFDCPARGLWAVADGMGGHAAGDIAAEALVTALKALADAPAAIDAHAVEAVLAYTGRRLHAGTAKGARVSGSTIVALHVEGARGTLFWAGDSRAYRLRDGAFERLTRDHSVVQELIDAGALAPEMADSHPRAHVITRALGAADDVEIETRRIDVQPGDRYLLCSDGLSRGSGDPDAAMLDGAMEPVADRLLDGALAAGGKDNISFVLIEVAAPEGSL